METPNPKADVLKENEIAMHTFQKKRQLWLAWLKTDEQHPISAEISSMAWNDVAFRTLARAAEIDPNSGLNNPLLAESLIYGHFAVQVLHIRRMMDRRKDVISLMRLLDDIEDRLVHSREFRRARWLALRLSSGHAACNGRAIWQCWHLARHFGAEWVVHLTESA